MEAYTGIPNWTPLHWSTVESTVEPAAYYTIQHAVWIARGLSPPAGEWRGDAAVPFFLVGH